MRKFILSLVFLCISPWTFADRNPVVKVTHAELEFEHGIKVILSMDRVALKSLTLVTDKGSWVVPKKELDGIGFPKLDDIVVGYGAFRKGTMAGVEYKFIRLRFGSEKDITEGQYPSVSFHFYDGKYDHREIEKVI